MNELRNLPLDIQKNAHSIKFIQGRSNFGDLQQCVFTLLPLNGFVKGTFSVMLKILLHCKEFEDLLLPVVSPPTVNFFFFFWKIHGPCTTHGFTTQDNSSS